MNGELLQVGKMNLPPLWRIQIGGPSSRQGALNNSVRNVEPIGDAVLNGQEIKLAGKPTFIESGFLKAPAHRAAGPRSAPGG